MKKVKTDQKSQMRPSRVLAKLRAGEIVSCYKLNLDSARAAEIAAEPLAELDEIAALKGIDMLFFGHGDFSHSIGVPGKWDDLRIADARRRVADAARKHGKFAGTVGNPDNMEELTTLGYRFINLGSDVTVLGNNCRAILKSFSGVKFPGKLNSIYGNKQ